MANHTDSVFTSIEAADLEVERLKTMPGLTTVRTIYVCVHLGEEVFITAQNVTYALSRFAAYLRDKNILSVKPASKKVNVESMLSGFTKEQLEQARALLANM